MSSHVWLQHRVVDWLWQPSFVISIVKVPNLPPKVTISAAYVLRTHLGKSMFGPISPARKSTDENSETNIRDKVEFLTFNSQSDSLAANASIHRFNTVPMDIVNQLERLGTKQDNDGLHVYSMPLFFQRGKPPSFPDNKFQTNSILKSLESKFKDNSIFEKNYWKMGIRNQFPWNS